MAVLEPINIDFQSINTGDPQVLIIVDTSTWGIIVDKPSIIEIIPPNKETPIVYTFEKSKTNVFNSSNLLLSAVGCFEEMPDGIYQITVKGSPDTNCKSRDVLKTDKFEIELDRLYIAIGFLDNEKSKENRNTLLDIESLLKTAQAYTRQGKSYEALTFFKRAVQDLDKYVTCTQG